ncbi:hypothetical protein M438DRAFT_345185 [Aureobasidium pullulans EXF-150]|uniref:Secreted protein n=1 Tax=Aureobasidium pullulans EXF-150 TaxID=1043002 RepID=A0A074XHJ7_AURPU|nr:uncharacterized protein M438DRAFT_345185 [Aureobasidium pullulans EXF-150]KEQ84973.1 hypothetical protein M438DRAFT_345185 [Aureobasidium pullulans EXF-150]
MTFHSNSAVPILPSLLSLFPLPCASDDPAVLFRTHPSDAARRSCPSYLLFNARSSERSVGRLNVCTGEDGGALRRFCLFQSAGERRDLA